MFWIADAIIGTRAQNWHSTDENPGRRESASNSKPLRKLFASIRRRHDERITTRHLDRLSDHLLQDIGIDRAEIRGHVSGGLRRHSDLRHVGTTPARVKLRPVEPIRKILEQSKKPMEREDWKRVA